MGGSVLLRRAARRRTTVLGGILRVRPRAGRAQPAALPRSQRHRTVGVRGVRLLGPAGSETGRAGGGFSEGAARRDTQARSASEGDPSLALRACQTSLAGASGLFTAARPIEHSLPPGLPPGSLFRSLLGR